MRRLIIISYIAGALWPASTLAQVTCQHIGSQTYCSNGLSSQQNGQFTYYNNGVTRQQIGPMDYYSAPPAPVYQPPVYQQPLPYQRYR